MSICEGIITLLEEQSKQQNFERVKTVFLEIGQLSCIQPEALEFSFDVVAKNTLADNAQLKINYIDAQAWCEVCEKQDKLQQRYDECPDCGHFPLAITAGEEMKIKQLEVD